MSLEKKHGHMLFATVVVLLTVILVAAGVRALEYSRRLRESQPSQPVASTATPVRVARVEQRAIRRQVRFHGFLAPALELAISADVPGKIVEQWVDVSADVERGQPLYKIDDAARVIEHEEALAALARTTSECEMARANWEHIEELDKEQASPIERKRGETAYHSAEAVKRRAVAVVERTVLLLERTTVHSPIDGVVSQIYSRRGEHTQPGQPLAEVIEVDRLKLLAEVEDRDIVWIEVGQQAILTTKTLPGEQFEAKVSRIYPKALPTSRKFEIEIELSNTHRRLHPGFFMTGTITQAESTPEGESPSGVLVVPREAVVEQFGRQFCHVVRAGEQDRRAPGTEFLAHRTAVRVLSIPSDARNLQVIDGVKEGDLVVTKGLQHLSEKTTVRIED